jgi:phage FluMu protein Com
MIIGASTLMSLGGVGSTPFCEHCNQWVEGKESISPLEPIANPDEFTSKLEQGGDAVIKALNKIEAADKAYTQIDLIKCPGCKHSNYLSIKSVEIQADSKGKEKKEEKDIIENFIISSDRYREIQQQW